MSVCVGGEKSKLYKGDYSPAQFYKGDVKIAGYTDKEKVGTSIGGVNTYDDAMELAIEGRSKQTVTVQGENLFDEERILPTQGWIKQSDGSFFVPESHIPNTKTLWENTDGYTGQLSVAIKGYRDGAGDGQAGPYILIIYTDGTVAGAGGAENLAWTTHQTLSDPIKSVAKLSWSYGGGGFGSYVKDILIAKSNILTSYEPFIPNSPSPDYPSPIRSSEDFDVVSCGRDPATATTAHVIDPLRSVGDVSDSIEVSDGKVEVVKRCNQYTFMGTPKDKIAANSTYGCFNGNVDFAYEKLLQNGTDAIASSLAFVNIDVLLANEVDGAMAFGGSGDYTTTWFRVNQLTQTKSEMETWLSKNPVTVQYVLGSPTRTDITATPLGQELLALRTQPHETKVFTNAALPPTLRAKIKEML